MGDVARIGKTERLELAGSPLRSPLFIPPSSPRSAVVLRCLLPRLGDMQSEDSQLQHPVSLWIEALLSPSQALLIGTALPQIQSFSLPIPHLGPR